MGIGGLAMTLEELKQGLILDAVLEGCGRIAAEIIIIRQLKRLAESGACFVVQENSVVWNVISLASMLEAEKK
jgi:hypothetical protein